MDKKPQISVSILFVVLLVRGSLRYVVGYQTVQSSNQVKFIKGISRLLLLEEIYE
jgi:hypothetical protein